MSSSWERPEVTHALHSAPKVALVEVSKCLVSRASRVCSLCSSEGRAGQWECVPGMWGRGGHAESCTVPRQVLLSTSWEPPRPWGHAAASQPSPSCGSTAWQELGWSPGAAGLPGEAVCAPEPRDCVSGASGPGCPHSTICSPWAPQC